MKYFLFLILFGLIISWLSTLAPLQTNLPEEAAAPEEVVIANDLSTAVAPCSSCSNRIVARKPNPFLFVLPLCLTLLSIFLIVFVFLKE